MSRFILIVLFNFSIFRPIFEFNSLLSFTYSRCSTSSRLLWRFERGRGGTWFFILLIFVITAFLLSILILLLFNIFIVVLLFILFVIFNFLIIRIMRMLLELFYGIIQINLWNISTTKVNMDLIISRIGIISDHDWLKTESSIFFVLWHLHYEVISWLS